MKKRILAFAVCMIAAVPLWSCGHDTPDPSDVPGVPSVEETSAGSVEADENVVNDFKEDGSYYTGVFNEEVFEHIRQNVNLNGVKVSFPCKLKDMGSDFRLERPLVFAEKSYVTYNLMHNDILLGTVLYYEDHELTDEEIETYEINNLFVKPFTFDTDKISVGGVNIDSDYKVLEDFLGQPTQSEYDENEGEGYYKYMVSEEKYVQFNILNAKVINVFCHF